MAGEHISRCPWKSEQALLNQPTFRSHLWSIFNEKIAPFQNGQENEYSETPKCLYSVLTPNDLPETQGLLSDLSSLVIQEGVSEPQTLNPGRTFRTMVVVTSQGSEARLGFKPPLISCVTLNKFSEPVSSSTEWK